MSWGRTLFSYIRVALPLLTHTIFKKALRLGYKLKTSQFKTKYPQTGCALMVTASMWKYFSVYLLRGPSKPQNGVSEFEGIHSFCFLFIASFLSSNEKKDSQSLAVFLAVKTRWGLKSARWKTIWPKQSSMDNHTSDATEQLPCHGGFGRFYWKQL